MAYTRNNFEIVPLKDVEDYFSVKINGVDMGA